MGGIGLARYFKRVCARKFPVFAYPFAVFDGDADGRVDPNSLKRNSVSGNRAMGYFTSPCGGDSLDRYPVGALRLYGSYAPIPDLISVQTGGEAPIAHIL